MSEYKPGTVARATVQGTPNVLVLRIGEGTEFGWVTADQVDGVFYHIEREVTDVRPLVVLDPTDAAVEGFVAGQASAWYAQEVRRQIEAQTKPPRIPEPGLWAVVEAGIKGLEVDRCEFVRYPDGWARMTESPLGWDLLIDPELIREGVES